jgi:hypothetical protein
MSRLDAVADLDFCQWATTLEEHVLTVDRSPVGVPAPEPKVTVDLEDTTGKQAAKPALVAEILTLQVTLFIS